MGPSLYHMGGVAMAGFSSLTAAGNAEMVEAGLLNHQERGII